MFSIGSALNGLVWPFILCQSATSTTFEVVNTGNIVYNSKWNECTFGAQKNAILMMIRPRNTFFIGFKMIRCTLEDFLKVILFFASHRDKNSVTYRILVIVAFHIDHLVLFYIAGALEMLKLSCNFFDLYISLKHI